jgi:hypothetical protein
MTTNKTPLEDIRQSDLKHYDELSTKYHHWSSGVPRAINFYYDYKQMNLIQKIILAFKNK